MVRPCPYRSLRPAPLDAKHGDGSHARTTNDFEGGKKTDFVCFCSRCLVFPEYIGYTGGRGMKNSYIPLIFTNSTRSRGFTLSGILYSTAHARTTNDFEGGKKNDFVCFCSRCLVFPEYIPGRLHWGEGNEELVQTTYIYQLNSFQRFYSKRHSVQYCSCSSRAHKRLAFSPYGTNLSSILPRIGSIQHSHSSSIGIDFCQLKLSALSSRKPRKKHYDNNGVYIYVLYFHTEGLSGMTEISQ